MAKDVGTITIKMDKETLENVILPIGEVNNITEGIVNLNKWAIPHWDWVDSVPVGSVKVNINTVGHILDRLKELFPDQKQEVMMIWLNYGWSVQSDLKDWMCRIDFSKIEYQE